MNKKTEKRGKGFKVTPWEVFGDVDYASMMKKFGILKIGKLSEEFEKEVLFRRKFVFAHRDFKRILDRIKKGKKFVMMTGLMPSGKFHLGHMMVANQMIFYQNLGAKIYIAVADLEAYNSRNKSLKELKEIAVEEYLKNYIALGLKPDNCEFYFQSERSGNAKKSNAYYRLASNFSRHASFNEFKAVYGELNPGKINSSLLQASDMFHAQLPEFEGKIPVIVPVGFDQDPHLRIARDIGKRYKEHDFIQLSSTYHSFLPSLKGGGKMSSSDENSFIALSDSPKEVEKKIKKYAFSGGKKSLEEHRKKGGNPDIDVSFQYLRLFEEDDKKLEQIYKDYKAGNLLTSELKELAIISINNFLRKHQRKIKKADKLVKKFL